MTATDTRPRFSYRLPDGEIVKVIRDHGDTPDAELDFQLAGGEIVKATLVSSRPLAATPTVDRAQAAEIERMSDAELDAVIRENTRIEWKPATMADGLYKPLAVDGPCLGMQRANCAPVLPEPPALAELRKHPRYEEIMRMELYRFAAPHNPDAVRLHRENQPTPASTNATRAKLPRARCVSNGDTPPCWVLVCPNPECGDVDTLHGTVVDVTAFRRQPLLTMLEMTCTSCGERCTPPTRLER